MTRNILLSIVAMVVLCLSSIDCRVQAQQPTSQRDNISNTSQCEITFIDLLSRVPSKRSSRLPFMRTTNSANTGATPFNIAPLSAGPNLTVMGSGTLGRLTKWVGFSSSNSVIGDSTIYEDKFGKVGIGTDSPTSKVTVVGVIEATGGFKFPDGSVTTSASINHDVTLSGDGTIASPLGVAFPLVLNGVGGGLGVIQVTNTKDGGAAIRVVAGNSATGNAGIGVIGIGGTSTVSQGGAGAAFAGGLGDNNIGGEGVQAFGGNTIFGSGVGGVGALTTGGAGAVGGAGVRAIGGTGNGAGNRGGSGIEAFGGPGAGGATLGLAGKFNGDVQVTGTLSKGGGAFKIDHPLDPENKYLYHSFVESPDMKNIYDGNVVTDETGDAIVVLPEYFEALNRDFRYQLTVIGAFAHAIIADKVRNNRFRIRTSEPNVEVSWQVTGIRRDAFANQNRIQVEEEKPQVERGYYLHPQAFNQPEERSVNWARDGEGMQQMKQRTPEAGRRTRRK